MLQTHADRVYAGARIKRVMHVCYAQQSGDHHTPSNSCRLGSHRHVTRHLSLVLQSIRLAVAADHIIVHAYQPCFGVLGVEMVP